MVNKTTTWRNIDKKITIFISIITILFYTSLLSASPIKDKDNINIKNPTEHKEIVVIFHGIFRSSWHMRKLARFLRTQGYEVLNHDYPSTRFTLEELMEQTHYQIGDYIKKYDHVHFVGYSMGGLLVRALLNKYKPKNLSNVVLLAPPNNGSEVADFLKNNWLYKKLYGPAGQQLTTNQTQLTDLLGKVDYKVGVIAGSFSIDPISSLLLEKPHDGKVSVKSTMLPGMTDHIIVSASHTFFPHNKAVHQQTLYFLKNGRFCHKDTSESS